MIDKNLLLNQIHLRLIDEGTQRIRKCINLVSDDKLWFSHNENTNSIGNLTLHLEGNVRQWLLMGVGNKPYMRDRDSEFDTGNCISGKELLGLLANLESDLKTLKLDNVDLSQETTIQGITEPMLGVIIHVIEHFSYHVGQITLLTKLFSNVDTEYYNDEDLDQN